MRNVFWAFALLGALAGGAILVLGVMEANGAPQQAAAAAIGGAVAIIPYVLARAVSELSPQSSPPARSLPPKRP